ncbi:MAG: enoyl-CoA hydratase/isomerase family protein [Dehalococcoidia bacterium]
MEYEQIVFTRTGRVAVITLNRPDAMNTTTSVMNGELAHAFRAAAEDDRIGCLVITGAGRAFCAGADVRAMQSGLQGGDGYRGNFGPEGRLQTLWNVPKPTIAAINGIAAGVAPSAAGMRPAVGVGPGAHRLYLPKSGAGAEFGSTFLLSRVVGLGRAFDLAYSGRVLNADEALRIGLFTAVYPHDAFMEEVMKVATELADGPTGALAIAKEGIHRGLVTTLEQAES